MCEMPKRMPLTPPHQSHRHWK